MMVIENKYSIGQMVYLRTDDEQKVRIVTEIKVTGRNMILYQISCGTTLSDHYDFELSHEVNIMIK